MRVETVIRACVVMGTVSAIVTKGTLAGCIVNTLSFGIGAVGGAQLQRAVIFAPARVAQALAVRVAGSVSVAHSFANHRARLQLTADSIITRGADALAILALTTAHAQATFGVIWAGCLDAAIAPSPAV